MKAHEAFPSKYLKTEDLEGKQVTVTIERVIVETLKGQDGEPDQHKPVIYFQKASRGMVLNRVNWQAIADLYGDDSDDWVDKKIILFPTKTQFGTKLVPCVRVKPPGGLQQTVRTALKPVSQVVENEDPAADMDDDIPF